MAKVELAWIHDDTYGLSYPFCPYRGNVILDDIGGVKFPDKTYWCNHPSKPSVELCSNLNHTGRCPFNIHNEMLGLEPAWTPDVLQILLALREFHHCKKTGFCSFCMIEDEIIRMLQEDPGAVVVQGRKEGWLPTVTHREKVRCQ